MPNIIFGYKRTRSQLTLPNAVLQGASERSPLKDAKSALRRNGLLGPLSPSETRLARGTGEEEEEDEDDELLLSPQRAAKPPPRIKRSASPLFPDNINASVESPSRNRERKRQKLELDDVVLGRVDDIKKSSLKHVRSLSVPESSSRSLTGQIGTTQNSLNAPATPSASLPTKRAHSVPVSTTSPFIDLRRPPVTPLRPHSPLQNNVDLTTPTSKTNAKEDDHLTSRMHVDKVQSTTLPDVLVEQTPKKTITEEVEKTTILELLPVQDTSQDVSVPSDKLVPPSTTSTYPPMTPVNQRPGAIFSNSPLTPVPETPLIPMLQKTAFKPKPSKLGMITEFPDSHGSPPGDHAKDSSGSSGASSSNTGAGRISLRGYEKSAMGPPAIPAKRSGPSGPSTMPKFLATGERNGFEVLMGSASKKPKVDPAPKGKEKATSSTRPTTSLVVSKSSTVSAGTARNKAMAGSSKSMAHFHSNTKGKDKAKEAQTETQPKIPGGLKLRMRPATKAKAKAVPVPKPSITNPPVEGGAKDNEVSISLPTAVSEISTLVDPTEIPANAIPAFDSKGKGKERALSHPPEAEPTHEISPERMFHEDPESVSQKDDVELQPTKLAEGGEVEVPPTSDHVPAAQANDSDALKQDSPPLASVELNQIRPTAITERVSEDMDTNAAQVAVVSREDDEEVNLDSTEVIPSSQEEPMDVAPPTPEAMEVVGGDLITEEAPLPEEKGIMVVDGSNMKVAPTPTPTPTQAKLKSSNPKSKTKSSITKRTPITVSRPTRVTRSASSRQDSKPSGSNPPTLDVAPKTPRKRVPSLQVTSTGAENTITFGDDVLTTSSLSDVPSEPKSAPASPTKASTSSSKSREKPYARPTFSTSSKQNPLGTVAKPANSPRKLVRSTSMHTTRPTELVRTLLSTATLPSSLSTLENALEKLAMPAPGRPNTSLGFNRDTDSDTQADNTSSIVEKKVSSTSQLSAKPHSITSLVRPNAAAGPSDTAKSFGFKGSVMRSTGHPAKNVLAKFGVTGGAFAAASRTRITQKASRETSLPTVMGSPVKGIGRPMDVDTDLSIEDLGPMASGSRMPSTVDTPPEGAHSMGEESEAEKKKQEREKRMLNASRRVSLASQALTQSLNDIPILKSSTTPGNMGTPATPPGKGKAKADAESQQSATSNAADGSKSVDTVTRASTRNLRSANKPPEQKPPLPQPTSGKKTQDTGPGQESLKILNDCVIFVDVRTDDGDDAGSLFVEMLESVGARILTRVGQTCTHIVFKNGLMSTLTRYRLLRDPKPHVVGIGWVVECIEQRKRVDETSFLVDIEGMNVAGTNKRRRSMLPKFISRAFDDTDTGNTDKEHGDGNTSLDRSTSSIIMDDGLTPLERARMRKAGEI